MVENITGPSASNPNKTSRTLEFHSINLKEIERLKHKRDGKRIALQHQKQAEQHAAQRIAAKQLATAAVDTHKNQPKTFVAKAITNGKTSGGRPIAMAMIPPATIAACFASAEHMLQQMNSVLPTEEARQALATLPTLPRDAAGLKTLYTLMKNFGSFVSANPPNYFNNATENLLSTITKNTVRNVFMNHSKTLISNMRALLTAQTAGEVTLYLAIPLSAVLITGAVGAYVDKKNNYKGARQMRSQDGTFHYGMENK